MDGRDGLSAGTRCIIVDTWRGCMEEYDYSGTRHPLGARYIGHEVTVLGPSEDGCRCCVMIDVLIGASGNTNWKPVVIQRRNLRPIDGLERNEDETQTEEVA